MANKGMSVFTHNGTDYNINDPNTANEFSTGTAYAKGDYVYYRGSLYRFTSAHSAGAWNSGHVTAVMVGDEIKALKESVAGLSDDVGDLNTAVSGLSEDVEQAEADIGKNTDKIADVRQNEYRSVDGVFPTGENLLNPFGSDHGFMTASDGSITDTSAYALYRTTALIPVRPSLAYTLSSFSGTVPTQYRKAWLEYNADGEPITSTYVNSTDSYLTVTTTADTRYVRISYHAGKNYQLIEGSDQTAFVPFTLALSEGMKGEVSEVAEILTGKNLFDMDGAKAGTYLSDGSYTAGGAWAGYLTTPLIAVKSGDKYTATARSASTLSIASNRKVVSFFDADKVAMSDEYINESTTALTFTVPSGAAFMAVTGYYNSGTFVLQLEKGTAATSYDPYGEYCLINDTAMLSKAMVEQLTGEDAMNVSIDGDTVTILSAFGNKVLKRTARIDPTRNGMFEFLSASVLDGGTETTIKGSSDDITPLRLGVSTDSRWTVGANHGWWCFTVAKGNLTSADIGSKWTANSNYYILADVTDSNAVFIELATLENHVYVYSKTKPTESLTHVSGATHTGSVSVSGAEESQLYPSVNNHTIAFYSGKVKKGSGKFSCGRFTVREEYTIIDYADLSAYLMSHIGTKINNNVPGCVRVNNVYEFFSTGCLVTTGYEALKDIKYYNCGIIQAGKVNVGDSNTLWFYTNNQNNSATIKSATLYNATSQSDGITIGSAYSIDADVAANRFVELVKDSNSKMLYGFVHGFIPDISKSADAFRKGLDTQAEFRVSTMKSYPVTLFNESVDTGDYRDFCCYRNYLAPSDLTNCSLIPAHNALYIIIDAHTQQTNRRVNVPTEYIGKAVEIVQSSNFTLKSDIVGAGGVVFDTTAAYGCAVLKVAM